MAWNPQALAASYDASKIQSYLSRIQGDGGRREPGVLRLLTPVGGEPPTTLEIDHFLTHLNWKTEVDRLRDALRTQATAGQSSTAGSASVTKLIDRLGADAMTSRVPGWERLRDAVRALNRGQLGFGVEFLELATLALPEGRWRTRGVDLLVRLRQWVPNSNEVLALDSIAELCADNRIGREAASSPSRLARALRASVTPVNAPYVAKALTLIAESADPVSGVWKNHSISNRLERLPPPNTQSEQTEGARIVFSRIGGGLSQVDATAELNALFSTDPAFAEKFAALWSPDEFGIEARRAQDGRILIALYSKAEGADPNSQDVLSTSGAGSKQRLIESLQHGLIVGALGRAASPLLTLFGADDVPLLYRAEHRRAQTEFIKEAF